MATRILDKNEEVDQQVSWEDQSRINQFSKLNMKMETLTELYNEKKAEQEYLADLSSELELADEDELVRYKIGDSFAHIALSDCQQRIEQEDNALCEELNVLKNDMDQISQEMTNLKALLYAKFGKSINLEK